MTTHRAFGILLISIIVLGAAFVLFTTVFCEHDWCDAFGRLTPTSPQTNQNANANTEIVNTAESGVWVAYPVPGQEVKSPLLISGQAKGTWFFEGVFTVRLVDVEGNTLSFGSAQAGADWMTENYVPFTASLVFGTPTTVAGRLVFTQSDPSGQGSPLTYTLPVTFPKGTTSDTNGI